MGIAVNSEKRVERFANQLSKGLVFLGAVLTALALMTVLSTIGRAFVGLQIGLARYRAILSWSKRELLCQCFALCLGAS